MSWWLFERYYLNTTGVPFHAPCNPSEILRWRGVVETLNRILYYGHFGRQDLQAENPDAGVCYYLVQNGVGTVVRETEDGSYLYPDVMIAAVEDREDG